jgi:hypothetical protein
MGYYIQTHSNTGKASIIAEEHGGVVVSYAEAVMAMSDPTKGVIVVINNGLFEAAGFAYDQEEFDAFTSDERKRHYVILDRSKVKDLLPSYKGD